MHVIVASSTPAVARAYVRVILLLHDLAHPYQPVLGASIEVRPPLELQGRIF